MSESVYQIIQFGRQSTIGSAVAATTVFPGDAGWTGFALDRAMESPDEDIGSSSREQPSRAAYGVRWATSTMPFVARFQDLFHPLEMHVAGSSGSPTSGGTAAYTYTYTFDDTSDTLKPYTIEYGVDGSTQDEWRAYGVIANSLELGFDALKAPGNSMWTGSLGLVGLTREFWPITGSKSPPATLETLEGHYTTLAIGTTATAFASLATATASLKQFKFTSDINAVGRAYGAASGDMASAMGRSGKGTAEFEALIAISSGNKTSFLDWFEESSSLTTERRWRIRCTGTSPNRFDIDFRARLTSVDVDDSDGERLYAVKGVCVKDSTLGGRAQFNLVNLVSIIP